MAKLLDNVKKATSERPKTQAADQSGIASLLRAKSGKATGTTGARASGLRNKMALADVEQRSIDMARQGRVAAGAQKEQLAAVERAAEIDKAMSDEQFQQQQTQIDQQFTSLTNDLTRFKGKLKDAKQAYKIELASMLVRAQDQIYLQTLGQIGAERRLESSLEFREEAERIKLGAEFNDTMTRLNAKSILRADQRQFETEMVELAGDHAVEMAESAIAAANTQAMWEGGASFISGAVELGAASMKGGKTSTTDITKTEQPTTTASGKMDNDLGIGWNSPKPAAAPKQTVIESPNTANRVDQRR